MPSPACIVTVTQIRPHPDADRLELLTMDNGIEVVVGPHYVAGQRGIYIAPGWYIPGYLAEDMWMVKKGKNWVLVEERIIRSVTSAGLFVGEHWQNDRNSPWQPWPLWRKRWVPGEDVTDYLGLVWGGTRIKQPVVPQDLVP